MQQIVRALLVLGISVLLCGCVSAQQWHFSNGWQSGKRSSLNTDCHFRPQVKALISRIIQDELTRLEVVCTRPTYPLPDTRPFLQSKSSDQFEPDQ